MDPAHPRPLPSGERVRVRGLEILDFVNSNSFVIWCLAFGDFPLSTERQIVPDEKDSKGSQEQEDDEEDLLRLHICSQVNQKDPQPQGGVEGHHHEQKELQRPTIGQEEVEC